VIAFTKYFVEIETPGAIVAASIKVLAEAATPDMQCLAPGSLKGSQIGEFDETPGRLPAGTGVRGVRSAGLPRPRHVGAKIRAYHSSSRRGRRMVSACLPAPSLSARPDLPEATV
jgi:hypothetical protein